MAVYGYTFFADSKQSTKIKIAKPTFFLDTGVDWNEKLILLLEELVEKWLTENSSRIKHRKLRSDKKMSTSYKLARVYNHKPKERQQRQQVLTFQQRPWGAIR